MNYKNEKSKFHHRHKLLIKGRIIKPVPLENVLKVSIRSSKFCALDSLQEEVFLKFA